MDGNFIAPEPPPVYSLPLIERKMDALWASIAHGNNTLLNSLKDELGE
ncbi:protein of unknown function [Legionella hackeliae]|uniref:Uncharacterized protein n=1 Tax=Legionella hackeliae TaxID=449 RepID=A0A0A8UUK3_LEGHA|nr:protein of unknown function [Legionella hackeliae]